MVSSAAGATSVDAQSLHDGLRQALERGQTAAKGHRPQSSQTAALSQGLVLLRKGDLPAAIRNFRSVLASRPHHLTALINMGCAQVRARAYCDAAQTLSHARSLSPQSLPAHINLAQTLLGARAWDMALEVIEQALVRFPGQPSLLSSRADALRGLKRPEQALADVEWALSQEPGEATHLLRQANCLVDLRRYDQALEIYERLTQAQRESFATNVGLSYVRTGQAERALPYFEKALSSGQDPEAAWGNRATAHLHLGQWPQAFQAMKNTIDIRPAAEHFCNLSLLLMLVGEYRQGLELYEWRLRRPGGSVGLPASTRWNGRADLRGKTLFVAREQGAGDMIQLVRYLPGLIDQGVRVMLETPKTLERLMRTLHPALEVIENGQRPGHFDAWIELMSLPHVLGTTLETIPPSSPAYLHADPILSDAWRTRLQGTGGARQLGFTWQGNPQHTNDRNRSIQDVRMLARLFSIPDTHWHCLQADIQPEDRDWLASQANVSLWDTDLSDYAETAALMMALDQVVAVDTSVAHLAGALDRPLALLIPFSPDWRWGVGRNDSPWYASACLYRQPAYQDWSGAIANLARKLEPES